MHLEFHAFSDAGPRATNEDRYLEPSSSVTSSALVAIADGMGGAAGGEEAATLAVNAARRVGPDVAQLTTIFSAAALAIKRQAELEPEKARMGTTLSLAAITGGEVHVAHVGDTRIYHLRGRGLNNLTQDQTEVAELVRRGVLSDSQARRYPRRNVLLSALTAKGAYEIYRGRAKLEVGDRLLLLTDGVHQRVKRGAISTASQTHSNLEEFVLDIKRRVLEVGPSDNFTALAVEIQEL